MGQTEDEVWQTIQALNRCWTSGDPARLNNYFHENNAADQFSFYPEQ